MRSRWFAADVTSNVPTGSDSPTGKLRTWHRYQPLGPVGEVLAQKGGRRKAGKTSVPQRARMKSATFHYFQMIPASRHLSLSLREVRRSGGQEVRPRRGVVRVTRPGRALSGEGSCFQLSDFFGSNFAVVRSAPRQEWTGQNVGHKRGVSPPKPSERCSLSAAVSHRPLLPWKWRGGEAAAEYEPQETAITVEVISRPSSSQREFDIT